MSTMTHTGDTEGRELLIGLLKQAAKLEHCLLNAYLYAASSIKSMPWEFGSNRRSAIQFERARVWKQNILNVAHEEMLHLHYVQCMLRALGESPCFDLPSRDKDGAWFIPGWRPQEGNQVEQGASVPVDRFNLDNATRFVLYESTDSLQDQDPFGGESSVLYEKLYDFELDLFLEGVVFAVTDEAVRETLKTKLRVILTSLSPKEVQFQTLAAAFEGVVLPKAEEVRFQSIADLYNLGILPLYQQAFDFGWVKYSNLNLDNEQLDPAHAGQGFLPIGPVFRSPRFARFSQANVSNQLRNYKNVADIVKEIVEEGEGFAQFRRRAEAMLADVAGNGGPRAFLTLISGGRKKEWPAWANAAQLLRKSHLYQFCMTRTELMKETDLARAAGLEFQPDRAPVSIGSDAALSKLASGLAAQFNVCNLVMTAWLARMYEIPTWAADTPRRQAIEMVATWPLMSLAIRPFLELATFFAIDVTQLFRTEVESLPSIPVTASQLLALYKAPERTEEINERMDYLAMRALAEVASWASAQIEAVENSALDAEPKQMILTRLKALSHLDEFEKQFPFRVHGGYSSTMPDITYQNRFPDAYQYSEDPSNLAAPAANAVPVFQDSLVLRLRFAGWGLVQLSTDPDPPSDESGCTGTIMLHPADGPDRRMDRALWWQQFAQPNLIVRGPSGKVPPLGVNLVEAALLVTDGAATAGYTPLQIMNSTGAVQASGVQQDLAVSGLNEIVRLNVADNPYGAPIRFYLAASGGGTPHLEGLNHLVWQDGEPIDPFVFGIYSDSGEPLARREIFNDGKRILEMNPLQRLLSARAPCGFDSPSAIPDWALTPELRKVLSDSRFPISFLDGRARDLAVALEPLLQASSLDKNAVDEIMSLAYRMLLVSAPNRRGTTVGWMTALLHYGHTISGPTTVANGAATILAPFQQNTNMALSFASEQDRTKPNSRWLAGYTKGVMDVDSIRDFIYGELYVPIAAQSAGAPITMKKTWSFPSGMEQAVAAYACNFAQPFWANYEVTGNVRVTDSGSTTVTEMLTGAPSPSSYSYSIAGFNGVASCSASMTATGAALTWSVEFDSTDAQAIVALLTYAASSVQSMGAALAKNFAPA